jgi:C-terminal processing protease CtpA/Prc
LKLSCCVLLCLFALVVVTVSPVVPQEKENTLSVEDKLAGLSLVWQEANYNFAFFDRSPDLDWDAEFKKAIVRVMATKSDYDYIREIQRFVALLGEAHSNLSPGRDFRERYGGHPAVEIDEIERKPIIINTSKDLVEVLPVGSIILAVDGVPVNEYLRDHVFPYLGASTEHFLWRRSIRGDRWRTVGLLMGEVGSTVKLEVEIPDRGVREISLGRLPVNAVIDWQATPRSDREILTVRKLDDRILYFAINTFNNEDIVPAFEAHIDELASARAVVLDVRNNGGGNSRHGWYIGRYFSDTPLEVSHWRTRKHLAAYKAWGSHSKDPEKQAHAAMNAWYEPTEFSSIEPPERTFVIPVAVLVGSSTYSAAEDFLAFMRAVPNCVFVGGRSAGSTGQPLAFEIPGGAWVGITSKRDVMPDGTEFVGFGVAPDVEVQQTVAAFREGRDLVLERAVEVLEERLSQ